MQNFDLKKVIEWLGLILKCPICGSKYQPNKTKVIDSEENEAFSEATILIHSDCNKCKSSVMFNVEIKGPEVFSVGMVTDLTQEDSDRFKNCKSINPDDVIKIHKSLKTFKGDFVKILKDK